MKTKRALILFTRSIKQEALYKSIFKNRNLDVSFYAQLVRHTINVIENARINISFDVFIASDSDILHKPTKTDYFYMKQNGSSFAERIDDSILSVFRKGYRQIILIGNDCPDLNARHLIDSFHGLRKSDVVLGPAMDGGVYLIGLRAYQSELLSQIHWYFSSVYKEILNNLEILKLSVKKLDVLCDIDSFGQLKMWRSSVQNNLSRILGSLLGQSGVKQHVPVLAPFNHKKHLLRRYWQKSPPAIFC